MKDIWIIANWKSNKTIAEALEWIGIAGPDIPRNENLKAAVCPPFCALSEVKKAVTVGNFPLLLGAQDLSPFGVGAYTGEEPAEILNQLIDFAILGHSERRKYFGESDETVAKKTVEALSNNITPLVCIQNEDTPVPPECRLIAYEPVWAIGSGFPDTPQNAGDIAKQLKGKYGRNLKVLYGGSVNTQNAKGFIEQENIDGVLVGNASLSAEEFAEICKNCVL